jgi:hypothetical protein
MTVARMFSCSWPSSSSVRRASLVVRRCSCSRVALRRSSWVRVVQHRVQSRGALEGGDLPEQRLARTRTGHALDDDLLPRLGEIAHLQYGEQNGRQQRHGDHRQPAEHQAAQ